jgi:hypothetical protein
MPPADADPLDPLVLAMVVRDALRGWHSLANKTAIGLAEIGAYSEAAVVQSACIDSYKTALDTIPNDGIVARLLEAEALAVGIGRVLRAPSAANAATARALAAAVADMGADQLAEVLLDLAREAAGDADSPAGESTSCVTACRAPTERNADAN